MSIKKAYDELVAVILWIDERTHQIDIAGDDRSLIAAACLDMVLEHQNAVARLIEHQLYGSALAMLRVLAEAYIRGTWFARCADAGAAARYRESDSIEGVTDLVKDIEGSLDNATDTLSRMVRNQWGTLCGFTHTGYHQVVRRFSGALLKPNYPDAEIIQGLNFCRSDWVARGRPTSRIVEQHTARARNDGARRAICRYVDTGTGISVPFSVPDGHNYLSL
jgi:hypothetical protein